MNPRDPKNNFPHARKEILSMKAYSAPLENRRNLLRLDFNENTLGPSPRVLEAIQSFELNEISIYPEYNILKEIVSKHYTEKEIPIEEIGLFNGADAAINAIFNSFGDPNQIFLTTSPTFGYYSPCAEMRGMEIINCPYIGKDFLFPKSEFKENILKYKPKLIFICNPNNPTGTLLKAEEIIDIANQNQESLLVVDELYEKFYGDTLLHKVDFKKNKNIIVIQSLSKTAGLAGLRIGFAFGNKKIIEAIKKVTGPYDINSIAVKATIAALGDKEYIDKYIKEVKDARIWIKDKFDSLDIRSHFCSGNYFLIWPNKDPNFLEDEMRQKGILIRNMQGKKIIDGSIRVSIGTKKQMKLFWDAYSEIDQK
tara:strand:+ start:5217 stop:6317 length:1101 start_codon:yes stop_codon:yes gene_type:complete